MRVPSPALSSSAASSVELEAPLEQPVDETSEQFENMDETAESEVAATELPTQTFVQSLEKRLAAAQFNAAGLLRLADAMVVTLDIRDVPQGNRHRVADLVGNADAVDIRKMERTVQK